MYVIYQLNNLASNPYSEWLNLGSPKTPTAENFKQIRDREVTYRLITFGLTPNTILLE